MIELFPEKEGKFVGIVGLKEFLKRVEVDIVYQKVVENGFNIGPAELGYSPAFGMMISGKKYRAIDKFCRDFFRNVKVEVK